MKEAKDNKGISLIALIITITVMIIIAGVSMYNNTEDMTKSDEQLTLSELEEVKHFVGENYLNYVQTNNDSFLVGTKISNSEAEQLAESIGVTLITIPNKFNKQKEAAYYRLNINELAQMGIDNAKSMYVVNYVTGEVINETILITSSGRVLYTYSRSNFDNDPTMSTNKNEMKNIVNTEKAIFNSL